MCRSSSDYHTFNSVNRLRIRSFMVLFSGLTARKPLPQSLTLLYMPRINDDPLEVDGSKIRPDSAAFVGLHRGAADSDEVVFGSRKRVVASEGVRFEVYLREEKVLRGTFWRDNGVGGWRLECKCAMESDIGGFQVAEAEVLVAVEGHVAMNERVAMVARRRGFSNGLEEIPEEREVDTDSDCDCGEHEIGSDGGDSRRDWSDQMDGDDDGEEVAQMDMEGVRWAVDVGIWIMCLGVGFLVSKASSKTLRRKRIL